MYSIEVYTMNCSVFYKFYIACSIATNGSSCILHLFLIVILVPWSIWITNLMIIGLECTSNSSRLTSYCVCLEYLLGFPYPFHSLTLNSNILIHKNPLYDFSQDINNVHLCPSILKLSHFSIIHWSRKLKDIVFFLNNNFQLIW